MDTCILREFGLDSSTADLLRTIRRSGIQQMAVPWMAMEELAAQHAVKYHQQHEATAAALDSLRKLTPWGGIPQLADRDLEGIRDYWRKQYESVVDIVPTSENALRQAAFREANGLAPSKTASTGSKSVKTGYRDAAIWLSAVEYARQHPNETVYFVSSNTRDFGDGSAYRHPMDDDVVDLGDRFVHLTSLDQIVPRFTETTEVPQEQVHRVLARCVPDLAETAFLHEDMTRGIQSDGFDCIVRPSLGENDAAGRALAWIHPPDAELAALCDVSAYRIGEREWCTATARWHLAGPALLAPNVGGSVWWSRGEVLRVIGCAWQTRMLCTLDDQAARPQVLRTSGPSALSPEEFGPLAPDGRATVRMVKQAFTRAAAVSEEGTPTESAWRSMVDERRSSWVERQLMEALDTQR
ncbi:PIN domain-containing protein [Streptomyces sp. NBC_01453]|uniref:PIN domain-containing protein n=1 Tax=Streptomyces sp. NBC_01453 TaxID=2903873 RepID=UPI002E288BAB|nr:PIN domain-containing protein [Streptomyces sp. NBC_01453]